MNKASGKDSELKQTVQNTTYRLGTHRICTPEDTLARVRPHMQAMGITRIADVTGLDTIGIPVVMVCRPNARSVSVSQGKGNTLAAAQASGLMESIEGYHAEHIEMPLRLASWHELGKSMQLAAVDLLPALKNSPFSPHFPIPWIEAEDLITGVYCWLPYEMVHTNYTLPRVAGSGCFPASSNGLASGNSVAEATVHAICEIIERDALAIWHQYSPAKIDRTSINADTIDNALCIETLQKLSGANQDTFIWDITSDTGIPSYLGVIMDRESHSHHIGVGSGTHLCKEVALLRALHEAVQVRTTYIVGARDDITADEYTKQGIDGKRRFFTTLIEQSSFSGDFRQTSDCDCGYLEQDLDTLLSRLRDIGIKQVLRVNLRKPEFDIAVVRVVIPGMEAPHDDEAYVPGQRAIRAGSVVS